MTVIDPKSLAAMLERQKALHASFPLMSISDVAAERNVSIRTLRRLQARGKLPQRIKHGRTLMYRKIEIAQFFDKREKL